MNLQLLTDATPLEKKEWANLKVYSLETQFPTQTAVYSFNVGEVFLAADIQVNPLPALTGGIFVTFSPTLQEVVISGLSGVNTSAFTTDGTTFTQILTSPTSNPGLAWSPTLNYYGYINVAGTDVYTSVDHVVYVIGTPAPAAFNGDVFMWSNVFNKFIADSVDPFHRVFDSVDGKTYVARLSNREVQGMAESKELHMLVAVGDSGPQYSLDGVTWINSPQVFDASGVAWSPSFNAFVTVPRGGTKTECWRSSDGINWTVTNPFSGLNNIRCIIWIQDLGVFIAGGDNEYFALSQDGLTWRRSRVTGTDNFYGAAYVSSWGEYFLAGNTPNFLSNGKIYNPQV